MVGIMNFAQLTIFLFCATPVAGEQLSGRVGDVAYVMSDSGQGVFQAGATQWAVFCTNDGCDAHAPHIDLHVDTNGLTVGSDQIGRIFIWDHRIAQPLPRQTPLAPYERAMLLSGGGFVVTDAETASIDQPDRIPIDGISVVVNFMELQQGLDTAATPTSYLALTDGHNTAEVSHLVPNTKPQIEFAIRAQQ